MAVKLKEEKERKKGKKNSLGFLHTAKATNHGLPNKPQNVA